MRWEKWFEKLWNAISTTLDDSAIDAIEQMSGKAALTTEPSMEEVKEASGNLTNGKAVGTDPTIAGGVPRKNGLIGACDDLTHSRYPCILGETGVKRNEMIHEWKDAGITVLFKKKVSHKCSNYCGISLGPHEGKDGSQDGEDSP
ncbi:unnamed protein product [Sphacelaria rigidula]